MPESTKLQWAIVGYYRWWLWFDGPELSAMENATFTPESIRRIGSGYKANRGLFSQKSEAGKQARERSPHAPDADVDDFHADGLASLLNARISDWLKAETLRLRADICLDIAAEAFARHHTNRIQVSAVSKLMWFVKPAGWTVFDQFATKGALCHRPLAEERRSQSADQGTKTAKCDTAVAKANRFYDRLDRIRFTETCVEGNEIIRRRGWGQMPMERVYDQQLWLGGLNNTRYQVEIQTYRHFIGRLPAPARSSLDDLVVALGDMPSMIDAAREDHRRDKAAAKNATAAKTSARAGGQST